MILTGNVLHAGPNVVIRSGQGPQFASAAGPGSQTAISNSGPGAQQTAIGQNSLIPPNPDNLFGAGTGLGATLLAVLDGLTLSTPTQKYHRIVRSGMSI